jgi:hypothetical protein
MAEASPPPPDRPVSPRPLSEVTQAAASVALGVYLLGLVLAILGNSVSGSSALVRTLKDRLFSPWMAVGWLDLGFDHPFTYGRPEDSDHLIEIRSGLVGGSAERDPMRFPGFRTKERAARWHRLARSIALAAAEDAAAPLAAGVGAATFTAGGSHDLTVRVLRSMVQERTAAPEAVRFEQVYAARVRTAAGELQLVELGGEAKRGELAPLVPTETATP